MVKKQINVVHLSEVKPIEDNQDEREVIKQTIEQEEQLISDVVIPEEAPKEKPKRKTPTKKTKVIEEENKIESIPEPVVETSPKEIIKQPEKKIKTIELHKCEKCNKEMTQRALRYTHPQYCTGQEVKRTDVPVKRQAKPTKIVNDVVEITPDILENHLRKVKENKLKERQEKISKLVAKIV